MAARGGKQQLDCLVSRPRSFDVAYWTRVLTAAACAAALTGSAVAQTAAQDTPVAGLNAPTIDPPSANDIEWVRTALAAAKVGNLEQVRIAETNVAHPVAHKLLEWMAADQMGNRLSFAEIDQARRDLLG